MPEKEPIKIEEERHKTISRREFLKDAGLIVGGATVALGQMNACGNSTVTAPGQTATQTVTATTTVGAGSTITTTITAPGATSTITTTKKQPPATTLPTGQSLISLDVNDHTYNVVVADHWPLSYVLRDKLGLYGTKKAATWASAAHAPF
jgi:aerobic-type carbon monoxide dehydrogenase small subunit (CoxS/CutS family)